MISIIIPIYNGEQYLRSCLDSLVEQTDKNFKAILINDGSTDNSYRICKNYCDKNKNFELYSQLNKGITYTRNISINYVKTNYFIFLDCDDILHRQSIEILNHLLEEEHDCIIYGIKRFKKNISINFINETYIKDVSNFNILKDFLLLKKRGYIAGIVINKNIWEKNNLVFELEKYIEDWYPIYKYITYCSNCIEIENSLYFYRQNEGSAISMSSLNIVNNYCIARNQIYELTCHKYNNMLRKYIVSFLIKTDLEILHELYKMKLCDNVYNYDFNGIYSRKIVKYYELIFNNKLNFKEKIVYCLYLIHLYNAFKKFFD